MPGVKARIAEIEEAVHADLDPTEIVQSFIRSLTKVDPKLTRLEQLVNRLAKRYNHPAKDKEIIKILLTEFGLDIFKNLNSLGCYQDSKIPYCFGGIVLNDSIILWQPSKGDISV